MSWQDEALWAAMLAGEGCPMCADIHLPENPHSFLVADLAYSYVRLPKKQDVRGWALVALKRHANELYDLAPDELAGFWAEVAAVARAVTAVFRPVKLYYGVFGGRCPHVHCHIRPMYPDSDPHAPVAMGITEVVLELDEYQRIIIALREELSDRL